ncbi:MAG: leucine-rich repeat domain-containing protein [Alistipes sp.]|nr:leucine-rich repeat domain-containing protein [Alistipes sp.]
MKTRIIAAAAVSTAVLFTGCGDKASETAGSPEISAVVSEEAAETTEQPTDRVPVIEEFTDFEYEIIDGAAVITKYTGSSRDVAVPGEIDGAPVSKIGFYAFEAKFLVETVTLPESVTCIDEYAFMDCSSLKSINIPEAVTAVERGAFVACTSLESLDIPANVEYIRQEAFTACEGLTSLTVNAPDLAYEDWGLETLPELTLYAPADSAVLSWAQEMGLSVSAL